MVDGVSAATAGQERPACWRRRAATRFDRLVTQDPPMQVAECRAGIDAEFVHLPGPKTRVQLKPVGATPGQVKGTHQRTYQGLVERVLLDEFGQRTDRHTTVAD